MKRTNTAVWMEKYNHWQINVQRDGKRRAFYSNIPGRNGQREANAKADAWLDEGIVTSIRCGPALDEFLQSVKATTSLSNYDVEERRVRRYIRPHISSCKVANLNDGKLQEVIDGASGLSKKSLKNIKATMVSFVKFCRRKKWTTYVPDDVTIPKSARSCERHILQPSDLVTLFSTDTTLIRTTRIHEDYINAFRFQVLTGLRPGELQGLMWTDIIDGYVCVQRSINKFNEITRGKNENAIRSFKLTPSAQQVLDAQEHSSLYVFPIKSEIHYKDRLALFCKSNGMTVVSPYELRHTFISMAKILPEGLIKSMVGHSKDMDTFGVYGHAVDGDADLTSTQLQSVFDRVIKKT